MDIVATKIAPHRDTLHRAVTMATLQELASHLQEVLGRQLTAYIAGVSEGKTVHRWATGAITTTRDVSAEQRLRTAYHVSRILLEHDAPPTVRAWFIGMNPELDDRAPAEVIREGRSKDALDAALTFAAHE